MPPAEDPGPVLFRDDAQVKMLHVSCQHQWDPDKPDLEGTVWVRAQTRSEALSNMALARRASLELDTYPYDDRHEPWPHDDLDDRSDPADSDDPLERHLAALNQVLGRQHTQRRLLQANDRILAHAFWADGRRLTTGTVPRHRQRAGLAGWTPGLDDVAEGGLDFNRRMLLTGPTALQLPHPPVLGHSRRWFRSGVADACRAFVARYPRMSPLVEPLRVTLLVVPPDDGQRRDLDNLLLDVLPAVNEHFKPPQHPWVQALTDLDPDAVAHGPPRRRRDLARLRSVVAYSVWSFQVIQLHREPEDPSEGVLAMLLGRGDQRDSVWSLADAHLEEALDPDRLPD